MKLQSRLSRAVDLVKAFETFEPQAVRRPDGGWAIGYGHTRTARAGAVVSRTDAEALLLYDLGKVAEVVEHDIHAPLNPNQLGALTAFAFNIGWENFRRSSVVERLNTGDILGAAQEIERWRRLDLDGGVQIDDALVIRRAAEKVRFLAPLDGYPRSSTPQTPPRFDHDLELPRRPFPSRVGSEAAPPPPLMDEAVAPGYVPSPPANESAPFPSPRSGEPAPAPLRPPSTVAPLGRSTSVIDDALAPEPPGRKLLYGALGVLGLVLFAVSVELILTGKPSAGNLFVGLLGALLMTPAAYVLLGREGRATPD